MSRVGFLAAFGFLLHALSAGVAVALGVDVLPLVPGVVLVAYAALAEPPLEAALSASSLGLVMDALSGSPVGLNMLACLLALLLGRLASSQVASTQSFTAVLFAAALSAGYHVFVLALLFLFGGAQSEQLGLTGTLGVSGALWSAIWNGALAFALFPLIQRLMVRLGLEERELSFQERLHGRAAATRKR